MKKFLLIIALSIIAQQSWAQKGIIRGSIIEASNGEPMFGVTVVIKGTTNGSISDFDGQFEIKADPGTYEIQASFISFAPITISGVNVKANEVTLLNNIRMEEDVKTLDEVIVTGEVLRNSEEAILTVKKRSASVIDGISAAKFRKIGDSDAASAIKRVTGVSVQDGKYVYVRGLGDRYTKTMLNNVDIPGLDPDRNTLQMDIFPTNLIDNMVISKSFVADLPADFTGGLVNIETKDFPEKKTMTLSLGMGYTPQMHFNPNYLSYEGGSLDFLGIDDGTRAIPTGETPNFPDPAIGDYTKEFNSTLAAQQQTSFMNYNIGISFGNQIGINENKESSKGNKLGYIFSLAYKSETNLYDNMFYGDYQRPSDPTETELNYATTLDGSLGNQNILIGGITGLAYKTRLSKYRLTVMHLQNGEKRAGQFNIDDNGAAVGKSGYTGFSHNLEFNQRGLTDIMLNGTHYNSNGRWEIDWRLSPTISTLSDPDIRRAAFSYTDPNGNYFFNAGEGGFPSRIWRNLSEINAVAKIDLARSYEFGGKDARFSFGLSNTYKTRDYEINQFDYVFQGANDRFYEEINNDPDNILTDEYIYPSGSNTNIYIVSGNNIPNPNQYNSNANNFAAYVSNEFNVIPRLKTVLGLRGEYFVQRHTGRDVLAAQGNPAGRSLDNEKVLDAFDLFPTANFIYALTPNQNLRVSYSRTIARPSFKELSFAQILDPINGRTFNGGLFPIQNNNDNWDGNLTETRINNFDLRWELFLEKGQIFSISGFYKQFDNPIEMIRLPAQQTGSDFQPRNVGDAVVYGAELEIRKSFDFISERLSKINFSSNLTYAISEVDMTDVEFNARKSYEKDGENIESKRPMAGQAPYIINTGLSYSDIEKNFDAGFYYNIQGPTLIFVGTGLIPDVYAVPFHSLNFSANKAFGPENRINLDFKVSNILNDVREEVFSSFEAEDQFFTRFSPYTTFSLGLKYDFF